MAPSTSRHARDSDEQPSQRSQSSGGARPRGRKRGFLENSKLTDQDRRHVRWKERELLQDMKENASELAKLTSDRFNDTTHKLDEIYEDVCYPREANLDASNLDELNQAVAKQSQSLGASDLTKYDVSDLVKSTREACCPESGGVFDWETLGSAAGACFRSVPDVSFLFGLMDTQVVHKERKRARRAREDDDVQASQPSEYTSKKDRKDAQAARLEVLQRKMESVRKKRMFDVVINPKSFTQTVENMFDTSFLVRNGAIEIGVDDRGVPYLENREGLQIEEAVPAQTQSIISITPAQWQEIASVWGHDEPLVGHRS